MTSRDRSPVVFSISRNSGRRFWAAKAALNALPYEEAMQLLGGDLYVKKATVEFNASALMDDRLDVCLRCARRVRGRLFRNLCCAQAGEKPSAPRLRGFASSPRCEPSLGNSGTASAGPGRLQPARLPQRRVQPAATRNHPAWLRR